MSHTVSVCILLSPHPSLSVSRSPAWTYRENGPENICRRLCVTDRTSLSSPVPLRTGDHVQWPRTKWEQCLNQDETEHKSVDWQPELEPALCRHSSSSEFPLHLNCPPLLISPKPRHRMWSLPSPAYSNRHIDCGLNCVPTICWGPNSGPCKCDFIWE